MKEEIAKIPHSWDDILYAAMPNAYELIQSIIQMINQFLNETDQAVNQMVD